MNNQEEDPYAALNLPRNATQAQIKSAYRKLALKYHPDKQSNEEDKIRSSEKFTKIGNAYEILGDPSQRAEYDRYGTIGSNGGGSHSHDSRGHSPFTSGAFFGGVDGGHPFANDPFFGGGGRNGGRGFMDPFEVFRNAFGHDLDDSFGFNHGFGSMHANSHDMNMNTNMNRGAGAGSGGDPFGNMMGGHMNMMNSMMNMQSMFPGMNQGGSNSQYSYSSSSSFGGGGSGSGGARESVSTSTRIINGKRQTITERTIVKPDGTVERTTETSGDDDFTSSLGYDDGQSNGNNGRYLQDSTDQQRKPKGFFGSNR